MARLLAASGDDVHVVAAGRPDALRISYGHWTHAIRRSRLGLLLRPDHDVDGALLGAALPRRAPVALAPGRGYLVADGDVEFVQIANGEPEATSPRTSD